MLIMIEINIIKSNDVKNIIEAMETIQLPTSLRPSAILDEVTGSAKAAVIL